MGRQNVQCDTLTQQAAGSVGTSAAEAAAIRGSRVICEITNTHGSQSLYVGIDSDVTSSLYSYHVPFGETKVLDGYCGAIWVIGSGASTTYHLVEGYTPGPTV